MLVATNADYNNVGNSLVYNYVKALAMRRKMHTAGALFSGRQPIQNALVPGGVTTLFSSTVPATPGSTDYDKFGPYKATETRSKFKALLKDVREFINEKYILDVVTVANAFSQYWNVGGGCYRLLAYGDYPVTATGRLAIKRGLVNYADLTSTAIQTFSQTSIREYVTNSYYDYGVLDPTGLHPFDGKTDPNMSAAKYSWLKSPRLLNSTGTAMVCEVGPLARMVVTHGSNDQVTVNQLNAGVTSGLATSILTSPYNASQLITTALSLLTSSTGDTGAALVTKLFSPLGRHACRALEAKYLADAMALWVDELTPDQTCYTYVKIPKQIATGYGLCEAPRGALGHWIKIEGRKVAKYQCVVPSTWNFSPQAVGTAKTDCGSVEQSLRDTVIGTSPEVQIINILRVVHPFDCCIACAVHVLNPEGKETLKFAIGPDGRPTNIEVAE